MTMLFKIKSYLRTAFRGTPPAPRTVYCGGVVGMNASSCSTGACFSFCTKQDAINFHRRLPVVRSSRSPWYGYLQRVYNNTLPASALPIDLSTFDYFYLEHLPVASDCSVAPNPGCETTRQSCAGWLLASPTRDSQRIFEDGVMYLDDHGQQHARHHTSRQSGGRPYAVWIRAAPPLSYLTSADALPSSRTTQQNDTWIEVSRSVSTSLDPVTGKCGPEGMNHYGCWLVPARGSAVWLFLGRTVAFANRVEAHRAGYSAAINHDCYYARRAAARGYLTMQLSTIFSHPHVAEIIHTGPSCMRQPAPLNTACLPNDIEIRAGWQASLQCARCSTPRRFLTRVACQPAGSRLTLPAS